MKKLLFALTLTLSASAFAGMSYDAAEDGPAYLSWCTQDGKIATQGPQGQEVLKQDCTRQGLRCQEVKVASPHLNHIYAVCK